MRWNANRNPKLGTIRIRKGFLFFPRNIVDQTRWLETAYWIQQYDKYNNWLDYRWINEKDGKFYIQESSKHPHAPENMIAI